MRMKTTLSVIAATLAMATATHAQDYSARCLIEVAALTGQEAMLTSEESRVAAAYKARALDDNFDRLATASDDLWRAVGAYEAERRDYFENGLITAAEWEADQADIANRRATIREDLTDTDTPSCRFADSHSFLPVFAALRE